MGIEHEESLNQWNYFLSIEQDLENLSRYVEFSQANFNTFSIELARILFASSAEVDVMLKELCELVEPGCGAENIMQYMEVLGRNSRCLYDIQVTIPRYGLQPTPWENWRNSDSPIWWRAYNKVKHHRNENFDKSNLKNVLNSVAGLFVVNVLLYSEKGIKRLDPPSILFKPPRDLGVIAGSIEGTVALHLGDYSGR